MNHRIDKLCLPRYRRDAIWKFWQPNAKLDKIHSPIYWKSLDIQQQLNQKKKSIEKESIIEQSCSDGCHYTTLIGKDYHVYVDFEHYGLQHATWKESIEHQNSSIKSKSSIIESPWINFNNNNNNKQSSLNDRDLICQELYRYLISHRSQDHLFQLDTKPYPNRSMATSRRPRDVLHIDFYQSDHLKGSKTEATFRTFFHRKYLLSRHLRENTLKDLLSIATNAQLDIEIIGHFILHPNELSRHEIQMFGLTSAFGDIYEGHIIRINKEKLVLLLASAHHSRIQLSSPAYFKNIPDESKSSFEEMILKYAREYLQRKNDPSLEQIRRIQIQLEPLTNAEKRHVKIHFLSDDELIDIQTMEITSEQEPKLFQKEFPIEFYFLQDNDEQTSIQSVENQLKQLLNQRYTLARQEEHSYIQLTEDFESQMMNSMEKMLNLYANRRLSNYSREECMRIAIEYSFDDLLDQLDSNELSLNQDNKEIKIIIDEIRTRLCSQIERRLRAERTAKILLVGPSVEKKIGFTGKKVILLDHHRQIFIIPSNTYRGLPKLKDIQRHQTHATFHEEIDGGPKSFDRLPMSTDSLTILQRIQQRKRRTIEEEEEEHNHIVELGSGIHRLMTSNNQQQRNVLPEQCEQDRMEKKNSFDRLLDERDNHSKRTRTSIDTISYNVSAHTKQKDHEKMYIENQQRKKKRRSRSLAEYGKHRQKRKKCQSMSKSCVDNIHPKHTFFKDLFLLQKPKQQKIKIRYVKRKGTSPMKPVNKNAISNTSLDENKNEEETMKELSTNNSISISKDKKYHRSNFNDDSIDGQESYDEKFQGRDEIEENDENDDKENYLYSLYGSLSSTMKYIQDTYQFQSSQSMAILDLTHLLITFLHIRKDIAYETASTIISARRRLIQPILAQESSSSGISDDTMESKQHVNNDDDIDRSSSSGMISTEESNTILSENSNDDEHNDQKHFPKIINRKTYQFYSNKNIYSSNSQPIMSRITSYLSEADWRVYNYITKHFLQNGNIITGHAFEFSSALLIDLIEDSIYQTYFHLIWCSDSCHNPHNKKSNEYVKEMLIEEFLKKSVDHLLKRLQLINLPLLESIALMHTLKKYSSSNDFPIFNVMKHHPFIEDRDPCIWFSTDVLIHMISSFTDDLLNRMNDDYLSDYTKFEYLLISYFRKIEIVQNLQDTIEKKSSSHASSPFKCLLHVIDLNQAPKFFSDRAFQRFKLDENSYLNTNVEALKDLVLLDIKKRNIKSTKRPYLPLSMNDLIVHHQNRVITPSPWILAQYHRRWEGQGIRTTKYNTQKDSYRFDENIDSSRTNNLPPEIRALLYDMIRSYGTIEANVAGEDVQSEYEGLSEDDVAQMIANAIEAVEKFDRENNIGDRKLQNKKTVNDRLTEFFKYAGRHGVRLLDNVLKLAKLRSNDPKKYLPIAVNMLKDRLKQSSNARTRKQGVRFAHTLETLFTATDNEPELIKAFLKNKQQKTSKSSTITILDSSTQKITEEVHEKADISATMSITDSKMSSYSEEISNIHSNQLAISALDDENIRTVSSSIPPVTSNEFNFETILSTSAIPQIGLSVAQIIVLTIMSSQKPSKLTSNQIRQMFIKENDSEEQWQFFEEKLMRTTQIPDKFLLTEEQLVQIAMEENISIAQVERIRTEQIYFQLNTHQIRSLIFQMNKANCTLSKFSPLTLILDQFIDLCRQLKINLENLLNNETVVRKSSFIDSTQFTLTSAQIAYMINQAKFDIEALKVIERNLKRHDKEQQRFHLNSSQMVYLLANRRSIHVQNITGLSIAQLIGLYVLQQELVKDDQAFSFSLTYEQIKQVALLQNMTEIHFQSLISSERPFQLTDDQLMYLAIENGMSEQQILSVDNDQKSNLLNQQQFCCLINQHNQTKPSTEQSHHTQKRVCLNVEQILILANNSNIKLHELVMCTEEGANMNNEFHFTPEQLATFWSTSSSLNNSEQLISSLKSSIEFTLTDEQFRSLLHTVSPSFLLIHSPITTTRESNAAIHISQVLSTDQENQVPSVLTNQLRAMHERLKSSMQAHAEIVNIVSNTILKRNHIESAVNLVHQLSLHTIDDVSNKELETIPSFVLDLLKMNPMNENIYQSIKQGEITSNMLDNFGDTSTKSKEITDFISNSNISKAIVDEIQVNQLSFYQIHKIQTQFLTPKLIEEIKSNRLQQHVLDAYKSLSPLQIIKQVRSSITQLNTSLHSQLPTISQLDTTVVSVIQQTATKNSITTNEILNTGSSVGQVNILPQTMHEEPINIYPESTVLRQQILQELRDRLDVQLIELKKSYDIEPMKGKASIEQITNKLRTMSAGKDLELLINRPIDEVDILNILEGHLNHLLVQTPIDPKTTNELLAQNIQHRIHRTNERIQLVTLLQNHIENERLQRQMTQEEWTALVLEDIPKFERLTNLQLTQDDLRIISMNRFASLERLLTRSITDSEYRHLLQTDSPLEYIEQKLLKRQLTIEERLEQEELTFGPYQTSVSDDKMIKTLVKQKNIELTYGQLDQILQQRAELVDQYDILHWISPTIKQIEEGLDRSLSIDEKKRLIHDDYSMIQPTKHRKYKDISGKTETILPITASLLQLVERTQDKNLLENIKHLEIDLGRSLTKQELLMVAQGNIKNLEKTLGKSLSDETIKTIYGDRFTDLTNELKRDLTETEIRDILNEKLSGIEKALGRQLTSTERLIYKPANIVDLTASQLSDIPSIDTTIEELEDVLQRRLTLPEIQHLTEHPTNSSESYISIEKKLNDSTSVKNDNESILNQLRKRPIRFVLLEIEKAIGRQLNNDELERFAGSRFTQIEHDLGKSLNHLQQLNLLKGDKLTIENLINRKLSLEETGPHLVDLNDIERILNRSLSYNELINLSGDRFDDLCQILQRPLTQVELIDLLNGNDEEIQKRIEEKLDEEKEKQLKELPINRIRYFEKILQRKLSPYELLRFAEDRFSPILRLLSNVMKPEQILDLSAGRYDNIERFFNRQLTRKEKYELGRSILEVHGKYTTMLDELEYIIQRRLSEDELRNLIADKFQEIEKHLGKSLLEKQIRNILLSQDDQSLIGVDDLLYRFKIKYQDDRQRTRKILIRLLDKLDEDYHEFEKESIIASNLTSSSDIFSNRETASYLEFHQTTNDFLEQLSDDVRKHAIVTPQSRLSEENHRMDDHELKSEEKILSDQKKTPSSLSSSSNGSIKAFEIVTRTVVHIADKEHIEDMNTINNAIEKFVEQIPMKNTKRTVNSETTLSWLSNLDRYPPSLHLPTIKSIDNRIPIRALPSIETHPEEDNYLGWMLFKGADRPDLGLKEEIPRMINVKHQARTYVVGIPEEYADEKSRIIANKIYQGEPIIYQSSKSHIIKEMAEFVSQVFHLPIINDATHFIVPSRAYADLIEPTTVYQSELIDIEDDELQMRDSPETLEWYEECLQRNIQIHAQIPTNYQPSIVYCHTGRRTVITPGKRAEQRKVSMNKSTHSTKPISDQSEPNKMKDISSPKSDSFQRITQSIADVQSNESPSTARTVTDLIMHTVTTSRKTDLLEALDELFSDENLDKYQMTETHWQDIFLILLNSYLRSHALNRKDIFKRLTDKLHELRMKDHRRSSDFQPNISITSPLFTQTPNSLNELDIEETKSKSFHLSLRSSLINENTDRNLHDSEHGIILLPNKHPSTQSLSQNYSHTSISEIVNHELISTKSVHSRSDLEYVNENSSDMKLHSSINTNAIVGNQCPPMPIKQRRYRITVTHSDVLSDLPSNDYSTTTKSIKLPSIAAKTNSSQRKSLTTSESSSTMKETRSKLFPNIRINKMYY